MAKKPIKKKVAAKVAEPEFDNSITGVLFKNNKKRSGKKDPDMKGSFTDSEGNEYWLSAWGKDHKKYGRYLSISATLKEAVEEEEEEEDDNGSDDLPF